MQELKGILIWNHRCSMLRNTHLNISLIENIWRKSWQLSVASFINETGSFANNSQQVPFLKLNPRHTSTRSRHTEVHLISDLACITSDGLSAAHIDDPLDAIIALNFVFLSLYNFPDLTTGTVQSMSIKATTVTDTSIFTYIIGSTITVWTYLDPYCCACKTISSLARCQISSLVWPLRFYNCCLYSRLLTSLGQ